MKETFTLTDDQVGFLITALEEYHTILETEGMEHMAHEALMLAYQIEEDLDRQAQEHDKFRVTVKERIKEDISG
jgi:hypothetical protein